MFHIFFTQSYVDGHVGCFQFLASVKAAAVNTAEQVSLRWDGVSFGHMPKG